MLEPTPPDEGHFTIPTRIYLTADQRERLMRLVRQQEVDVPELLSELLVSFLDHLPEPEPEPAPEPAPEQQDPHEEELRKRRAEIRRLRARLIERAGDDPPQWLPKYLADLEQELRRLEEGIA
jgi:hypothetical protein